jgi:hypothetical protein
MMWYEVLAMLFAAVAAIGAWAAAWATKRAAEGHVLLSLLTDYAGADMEQALRTLRFWREQHGEEFASEWELGVARGDSEAVAVDRARRRVSSYFQNVDELWQKSLISQSTARAAADKAGLAVLINVCAPLERKVSPRVSLGYVRRLRALCPHRRDLLVVLPLHTPD